MNQTPAKPTAPNGLYQLLIDLGPIIIFVGAFNVLERFEATKQNAVYISVALFMIATLAAIGFCKATLGRIPPVLIITAIIVTAFGGLTLILRDRTFIQIKPTFTYLFYVAAILGSLLLKQNAIRLLFSHAFTLPEPIWRVLALRWSGFFFLMAVLNEIIRRTQSFDFWLNSRPLLVAPLILAFAALNAPLIMKHQASEAPGR